MQKNNYFVIEKGHMRDFCENILFDRERRKENYA